MAEGDVAKKYPYLSFLLDDPEVGPLLREADANNLDPDIFQQRLMQTSWWKRTSDTARTFYALKTGDPATYARRRAEVKSQIQEVGAQLGYGADVLDEGYLNYFSDKALEFGLSTRQIQAMIADEITPLVGASETGNTLAQIRQVQQAYSYAIDNEPRWHDGSGNDVQADNRTIPASTLQGI